MTLPQNRRLEELFDLPPTEPHEPVDDQTQSEAANLPVLPETLAALDKIESALPAVKGLEASDEEMDSLAKKASQSFEDLMDLGMQIDSRYAAEIFAVASQMLGHAITAKNAKLNKKLKMIELQMKKLKMDREGGDDVALPTAQGHVLDRNELLRTLLANRAPVDPKQSDG